MLGAGCKVFGAGFTYHGCTDMISPLNMIYFDNVVNFHRWLNVVHSVVLINSLDIYLIKVIYAACISIVQPLVKHRVTAMAWFSTGVELTLIWNGINIQL